jgi:hypothetical protein
MVLDVCGDGRLAGTPFAMELTRKEVQGWSSKAIEQSTNGKEVT